MLSGFQGCIYNLLFYKQSNLTSATTKMRLFNIRLRELVSSENLNMKTRDLFRKEVRALLLLAHHHQNGV